MVNPLPFIFVYPNPIPIHRSQSPEAMQSSSHEIPLPSMPSFPYQSMIAQLTEESVDISQLLHLVVVELLRGIVLVAVCPLSAFVQLIVVGERDKTYGSY